MNKSMNATDGGKIETLLRDLLITTLASRGVKGNELRKIVGCGMNQVTRIVKHMKGQEK